MNHANKPENLSYFHFNVRSLGKNKHKLHDFFLMTEVNPTFIAISETKLNPNFIVNIDIPGFNFVHNPSQTSSGGVGLYINSKLTYQLRNDLNLQNVGCESLFIETPTSSGKPFIIGVIYHHPNHAFPPFEDKFIKLVTHLQNKNCEYLIGGDFNCNLLKYHEQSNITNFVDSLASCGCISLINNPTRFSKNCTPSLLDHIYTNICDEKRINNAGITIYDISAHLPVFVNLKLNQQKIKPKLRCMKHFDQKTFLTDLNHNLNNLNPEAGEVNTLSDKFVKVFNDTLDKHAPYRYASRKEQRSFTKPWLTKGILTSIAKKNTLYRMQLTTNNPNIIRR